MKTFTWLWSHLVVVVVVVEQVWKTSLIKYTQWFCQFYYLFFFSCFMELDFFIIIIIDTLSKSGKHGFYHHSILVVVVFFPIQNCKYSIKTKQIYAFKSNMGIRFDSIRFICIMTKSMFHFQSTCFLLLLLLLSLICFFVLFRLSKLLWGFCFRSKISFFLNIVTTFMDFFNVFRMKRNKSKLILSHRLIVSICRIVFFFMFIQRCKSMWWLFSCNLLFVICDYHQFRWGFLFYPSIFFDWYLLLLFSSFEFCDNNNDDDNVVLYIFVLQDFSFSFFLFGSIFQGNFPCFFLSPLIIVVIQFDILFVYVF